MLTAKKGNRKKEKDVEKKRDKVLFFHSIVVRCCHCLLGTKERVSVVKKCIETRRYGREFPS
jgi:hypothetical protein